MDVCMVVGSARPVAVIRIATLWILCPLFVLARYKSSCESSKSALGKYLLPGLPMYASSWSRGISCLSERILLVEAVLYRSVSVSTAYGVNEWVKLERLEHRTSTNLLKTSSNRWLPVRRSSGVKELVERKALDLVVRLRRIQKPSHQPTRSVCSAPS